jgi:hypothetical protein
MLKTEKAENENEEENLLDNLLLPVMTDETATMQQVSCILKAFFQSFRYNFDVVLMLAYVWDFVADVWNTSEHVS